MRARIFVWIVGLLMPLWAGAAPAWTPAKHLDAWLDSLERAQLISGSIAISDSGQLRYRRSIGFDRIEGGVPQPADAGTRYRIGSVTGLFTAVLTMQLVEGASITLDSRLAEFYPDLPNALQISYSDLLRHRSGLAGYSAAGDFDAWRGSPRTHADMLRVIADGGVKFPPGERVEYSDSDFLLLGYVMEKVYERPYADIVRRRIADRLGLARTYYAGTGPVASLESISYRWTAAGWRAELDDDPSIDGGAAGMISNAADLITFIDALFAGKLVSAHSLALMRGQDADSGLGLRPVSIAGFTGLGERGSIESFNTFVYHFPGRKISVAWTGNASRVPIESLRDEILRLILQNGYRPPNITPAE